MISPTTICVLGATGNVGKVLVPHLSKLENSVRAYGRKEPTYQLPGVQNLSMDYDSTESLIEAMRGADITYVLVAFEYDVTIWEREWVPLTQRLIAAAQETKTRLVFFDNVYAYGQVNGPMTEKTPLNANSRKGRVREEMNRLMLEGVAKGQINCVIAKSADFYGPGVESALIGTKRFFDQIEKASKLEWFGDPDKSHTFNYLPDMAVALEKIGFSEYQGIIHLPAFGQLSGQQVKKIIEKITGKPLTFSPIRQNALWYMQFFAPILKEFKEMFYQFENDYEFDSSFFKNMFPEVVITSYEDGLKACYDAYLKTNTTTSQ